MCIRDRGVGLCSSSRDKTVGFACSVLRLTALVDFRTRADLDFCLSTTRAVVLVNDEVKGSWVSRL